MRVEEDNLVEWIGTVAGELETPNGRIIATRAKWLAKRMTQEPAPARLKDYLW